MAVKKTKIRLVNDSPDVTKIKTSRRDGGRASESGAPPPARVSGFAVYALFLLYRRHKEVGGR